MAIGFDWPREVFNWFGNLTPELIQTLLLEANRWNVFPAG